MKQDGAGVLEIGCGSAGPLMAEVPEPAAAAPVLPYGRSDVLSWPDAIDEVFAGDLVVAIGTVTSKGGVALAVVDPMGLRDRLAGTIGFTSSIGNGKKLERIAKDPHIAVAYHTRKHGHSRLPGYVLVQGRAVIERFVDREIVQQAAEHAGRSRGAVGRCWDWHLHHVIGIPGLKSYLVDRVLVSVRAERILWWPDNVMSADPVVLGKPLPSSQPASQRPPREPEMPRVDVAKVARCARKGIGLLGVLQADGMPLILPVDLIDAKDGGLSLGVDSLLLPEGNRRAGFLVHNFHPKLIGLWAATHTGWLRKSPTPVWTPHTRHYFYAPPNRMLVMLACAIARASRSDTSQGEKEDRLWT